MSRRTRRSGVVRHCAAVLAAVVVLGCSSEPPTAQVRVDGGAEGVAVVGDHLVAAAPGGTVTVVHAGAPARGGSEAPVTHAFIGGAGDALPPLFTPASGGSVPNAAVWGPCAGGSVSDAAGACPVPPVDGPQRWDGTSYWSTGAMLPGEAREIPLAGELPAHDLVLVCALHPRLRVLIGTEGEAPATAAPAMDVSTALERARGQTPPAATVSAGVEVDGAYVGRFVPAEIRVPAGQAVTWVAGGRAPVDVVFNGGDLDLSHTAPADGLPAGRAHRFGGRGELRSGFLSADPGAGAAGTRWSVTFSRPGRYPYASRFGPDLRGTVVVVEDR